MLIADETPAKLERLRLDVQALGHEVVATSLEVAEVAALTASTLPDVALVMLGESTTHALDLIGELVREASSPVIAVLATDDHAYVQEAAKRGVFACIVDPSETELRGAIAVALERFRSYAGLQGAFGRRAVLEQAKGILMGRDGLTAENAFAVLREHSQSSGRRIHDVASALIESNALLSRGAGE